MSHLVMFLIEAIARWIRAHPETPFSRFMLAKHGPRTDVVGMTRLDRLKSALVFLCWGILFLGLWWLVAYVAFGAKWMNPDQPVFMTIFMGLTFATGISIASGIYLLVRAII